jgi:hypothetical protein
MWLAMPGVVPGVCLFVKVVLLEEESVDSSISPVPPLNGLAEADCFPPD